MKADVLSLINPEANYPLYIGVNPEDYYRISYVATTDLILQVDIEDRSSTDGTYSIQNTKLIPCFVYSPNAIKPLLSYSPSGSFNESYHQSINFDIDDLRSYFNML